MMWEIGVVNRCHCKTILHKHNISFINMLL